MMMSVVCVRVSGDGMMSVVCVRDDDVCCVCEGYKGDIVVMDVSAVKEMMMSVMLCV